MRKESPRQSQKQIVKNINRKSIPKILSHIEENEFDLSIGQPQERKKIVKKVVTMSSVKNSAASTGDDTFDRQNSNAFSGIS